VTAPDLVEPVVAYRAWRIVGDQLLSPLIPVRWDGAVLHAMCHPWQKRIVLGGRWVHEAHASPHPDCQCGIYAHHRPGVRTWFGEFDWVEGVITVWGRLEAHADGVRAEHARIHAFIRPAPDLVERTRAIETIAARLGGVELIDRADAEAVGARVGAPLPPALLPG
jgi:hypothetical protein